jgi:hypothetical protein
MAFDYTVDAADTTGRAKKNQMVRENIILYTGTYTAGGDTAGTIDLTDTTKTNVTVAATKIVRFGIYPHTGTVTAAMKVKPNSTHVPADSAGKIGIVLMANDHVGTWWAECVSA